MELRQLAVVLLMVSCGGADPCATGACMSMSAGGGSGGSSASAGGVGGVGGGAASADCLGPCTTKAQDCGAPPMGAAQFCSAWCQKSPTAAQVSCLQSSSCLALMDPAPCGVSGSAGGGGSGGTGGGGSGSAGSGGHAGGSAGGTAGGGPYACAGKTCKSSSVCCGQASYCSPDSSACALQCKSNGASCFFDSECCNLGCDRTNDTCASCKPGGSACGNQNNNLPCCSGSCVNNQCASCKGPGEICLVNADCCSSSYCNSGKCFRRLADGGIP